MSTPSTQSANETSAVAELESLIRQGQTSAERQTFPTGLVKMWLGRVRVQLQRIYGPDSELLTTWPSADLRLTKDESGSALNHYLSQLKGVHRALVFSGRNLTPATITADPLIFIGHGHSPVWRELKDFIADRLSLAWDEFNRESVAGIATTERLEQMLNSACFAFLVMTGDDEHADSKLHARPNVIHEVGLFQGRLGMRRAIVLLEEGCSEFSNIHGLTHISFPRGRISSAFEEVRRVLEREQIITI